LHKKPLNAGSALKIMLRQESKHAAGQKLQTNPADLSMEFRILFLSTQSEDKIPSILRWYFYRFPLSKKKNLVHFQRFLCN